VVINITTSPTTPISMVVGTGPMAVCASEMQI